MKEYLQGHEGLVWLFSSYTDNHCYVSIRQSRKYILLHLAHLKISFILLCRVRTVIVSLPRVEIWYYGYLWEKIIFPPLSYEDAHNYRLQISSFSMTWWRCKTLCVCYSKISHFVFCLKVNCWIEIRKMLFPIRTKILGYEWEDCFRIYLLMVC